MSFEPPQQVRRQINSSTKLVTFACAIRVPSCITIGAGAPKLHELRALVIFDVNAQRVCRFGIAGLDLFRSEHIDDVVAHGKVSASRNEPGSELVGRPPFDPAVERDTRFVERVHVRHPA